jgi:hypothetical protein
MPHLAKPNDTDAAHHALAHVSTFPVLSNAHCRRELNLSDSKRMRISAIAGLDATRHVSNVARRRSTLGVPLNMLQVLPLDAYHVTGPRRLNETDPFIAAVEIEPS